MSEVKICNQALRLIGTGRITSLTEQTTLARDCAEMYVQCRDVIIRSFNWAFATIKKTLAAIEMPAEYEGAFSHAYIYPADCIQMQKISRLGRDEEALYDVVNLTTGQKIILTGISDAVASYTKNETDTTKFDPLFTEALTFMLASKLAIPALQDMNKSSQMFQLYNDAVSRAETADQRERKVKTKYENPWIKARRRYNEGY